MNGMSIVSKCEQADCFYNSGKACHVAAINVGDTVPRCGTFTRTAGTHLMRKPVGVVGLVGACHVATCRWNKDLMCEAQAITVGPQGNQPDCLTFEEATP